MFALKISARIYSNILDFVYPEIAFALECSLVTKKLYKNINKTDSYYMVLDLN